MRPETLRKFFGRSKHTKLFVDAGDYVVAGHARRSGEGDELAVSLSPYVAWFPGEAEPVRGHDVFGPVRLDERVRATRRLQTHRRHLVRRGVPEAYFEAAASLESSP